MSSLTCSVTSTAKCVNVVATDGISLFACADHPYAGEGDREDHGCEKKKVETEKEALLMDLHHVASIQQVLDGILTIGTLGHLGYHHCQKEPLDVGPHANPEYQTVPLASKEEEPVAEEEKEEEEEPPVEAAASAAHPNHNMIIESFKKEMLEMLDTNINGGSSDHQNAAGEEGDLLEPLLQAMKANRRERVTLADLFLASEDAPAANKADPTSLKVAPAPAGRVAPQKEAKGTVATNGKPAPPPRGPAKRGGSSLAKKLAPWKKEGEDSPPPAKKLQRVKCTLSSLSTSNAIHPGGHGVLCSSP